MSCMRVCYVALAWFSSCYSTVLFPCLVFIKALHDLNSILRQLTCDGGGWVAVEGNHGKSAGVCVYVAASASRHPYTSFGWFIPPERKDVLCLSLLFFHPIVFQILVINIILLLLLRHFCHCFLLACGPRVLQLTSHRLGSTSLDSATSDRKSKSSQNSIPLFHSTLDRTGAADSDTGLLLLLYFIEWREGIEGLHNVPRLLTLQSCQK